MSIVLSLLHRNCLCLCVCLCLYVYLKTYLQNDLIGLLQTHLPSEQAEKVKGGVNIGAAPRKLL